MKYRYLKILADVVWGTNEITKDDLGRLKTKGYDCILDCQENKMFNAENNEWVEIPGD